MPATFLEPEFDLLIEFDEQLSQDRDLVEHLTRAVHERTNRMIGDLRIEISASEIVLWGRTRAYYYKQLASTAILAELTGVTILNEIQVL